MSCSKFRWQGLFLQQIHSVSEFGYWTVHELFLGLKTILQETINSNALFSFTRKNMYPANPTFDRAGSQLKFRGVGDLIPHEDKWQLINHSTYLFRGGGGFNPLWRKCKLINHSTYLFRGGGGFNPLWRKCKLINHSTYLFRGEGGLIPYEESAS